MTGLSAGTTLLSAVMGLNATSRLQLSPLSSLMKSVQKELRSLVLITSAPSFKPSAPTARSIRPAGSTRRSGILPCTLDHRQAPHVLPPSWEKLVPNILLSPSSPSWRINAKSVPSVASTMLVSLNGAGPTVVLGDQVFPESWTRYTRRRRE